MTFNNMCGEWSTTVQLDLQWDIQKTLGSRDGKSDCNWGFIEHTLYMNVLDPPLDVLSLFV